MAHDGPEDEHHLGGGWIFLIVILVLAVLAAASWILWTRLRAKRLGLPTPSLNPFASTPGYGPTPARGGIVGWVSAKFRSLQNRRHAPGAYESTSLGAGGVGGRRAAHLDPDEAWDTRVGNEAELYSTLR